MKKLVVGSFNLFKKLFVPAVLTFSLLMSFVYYKNNTQLVHKTLGLNKFSLGTPAKAEINKEIKKVPVVNKSVKRLLVANENKKSVNEKLVQKSKSFKSLSVKKVAKRVESKQPMFLEDVVR